MNFGEKLCALLEERDITQKDFAAHIGVAPSTLSGYVQNAREPDYATLKLLAQYFDVSSDYLLDIHTGNTVTHQEDDLLRVFRSLSPEQRELYLEQGKVFIKLNHKERNRAQEKSS